LKRSAMSSTPRNITEWRQGHVLEDEAVGEFGLVSSAGPDNTVVIVISHDCDITADAAREPMVEVVIGRRIDRLGADTNAKTARRLHLPFLRDGIEIPVEFEITTKTSLEKEAFLAAKPRADMTLSAKGRVTLQYWLAARYHRAAFPEEFERRLKAKPGKLNDKIVRAMENAGQHVLAIYFDLDSGEEQERNGPDDVYELRITLLYDSQIDEEAAFASARMAADAIEKAFESALWSNGKWRDISLLSCDTASDNAMSVAASRMLKQWPLNHMSLKEDPPQVMMPSN
jgi:hypothetical protein